MSLTKAHGFILHSRKQGETSKILSVYTREFGRLSLMAKGSRGTRSKYLGTLETLNLISLVFYNKENRSLQYLDQATIVNSFPNIHQQLGKSALAAIITEVIERNELTAHDNPELFKLMLQSFAVLENAETGLRNIIRNFLLRYISLSGFEPDFEACAFCHAGNDETQVYFSLEQGVYGCPECGTFSSTGFSLSSTAILALRWLYKVTPRDAVELKLDKETGRECDSLLYQYLAQHFESLARLKSVDYLGSLEMNLSGNSKMDNA